MDVRDGSFNFDTTEQLLLAPDGDCPWPVNRADELLGLIMDRVETLHGVLATLQEDHGVLPQLVMTQRRLDAAANLELLVDMGCEVFCTPSVIENCVKVLEHTLEKNWEDSDT